MIKLNALKRRRLQRLTESWQIRLLSSVLVAVGVTILGITKMSATLAKSFIMTTFPHMERKEGPVRDANNTKQRNVPRLSEYDDVGHC